MAEFEENLNPSQNPETKTNPRRLAAVIVVAIATVVIIGFIAKSPRKESSERSTGQVSYEAPLLPHDFVLEANARASYHQNNTIQATEFDTVKGRGELVGFYTSKLEGEGWVVIDNREIKSGFYLIVAENTKQNLNINISIYSPQGIGGNNHVSIVLRNITGNK